MSDLNTGSADKEAGLTLIEVIFAIILFAGAMITILGLQSSNLARTNEDKNKIRAMLAAREILAAIEIQEDQLPTGTQEGSVDDILAGLIVYPQNRSEKAGFENLHAILTIADVGLPVIGENALQKVEIIVSWGDLPYEEFKTSYFLPGGLKT